MQRCTIWKKNSNNLTEAEEIKKRWQEYTEDLYKKVLMTWLTTMVVILECEVKWALGSIIRTNLVEVMEFQLSYFNPER